MTMTCTRKYKEFYYITVICTVIHYINELHYSYSNVIQDILFNTILYIKYFCVFFSLWFIIFLNLQYFITNSNRPKLVSSLDMRVNNVNHN